MNTLSQTLNKLANKEFKDYKKSKKLKQMEIERQERISKHKLSNNI
jgi:hypothetical protein